MTGVRVRVRAWAWAVVVVGWMWPGAASAEYWVETTGQLLGHATEIVVVDVAADAPAGVVEGPVVASYRGRKVGETGRWTPPFTQLSMAGRRALVICDHAMCPRAVGVEQDGFWLLEAFEWGDGAAVLPGLLDDAILRAALDSSKPPKPAPDVCLRLQVGYTDSAEVHTLTGRFSALDGKGRVEGDAVGAKGVGASVHFGQALGLGGDASTVVKLEGAGLLAFIGGRPRREADGCFSASVTPAHPLARTPGQVKARLAGGKPAQVLGTGTVLIERGPWAGRHPVSVRVDEYGQLVLDGELLRQGRVVLRDQQKSGWSVGFQLGEAFRPLLILDLGVVTERWPGAGVVPIMAEALARQKEAVWPVAIEGEDGKREVVGELRVKRTAP